MGADIAHQLNCDFGLGVAFFFFFCNFMGT